MICDRLLLPGYTNTKSKCWFNSTSAHRNDYYRYYYQHLEGRLRVCTLTVHGMVHVPDDILFCGPSWTTWTFFMERFCGVLQAGLRSKCFPWANLNNNVLHVAYLEQLNARYDLEAELSSASKMPRAAARTREYAYEECK
jgi:hypothetical protein